MEQNNVTVTQKDGTVVTVDNPTPAPVVFAETARTVAGLVLPFGKPGRTNAGALTFGPGSISIPTDISRVKLLAGHSPSGVPVGVATDWHATDEGVFMTFKLGSTPAADEALAQISDGVIDSFSIEAMGIHKTGGTVKKSLLKAVALVPFPAFSDARVDTIHAEADDGAVSNDTADQATDTEVTLETPAEPAEPADQATDTDDTPQPQEQEQDHMPAAIVPTNLHAPVATEAHASLDDVLDYIRAARTGEPTEAHAALVDITKSSMVDASAPAWLGELWSGVEYQRVIIPLLANKALTRLRMTGYVWTEKPGVDKYAGDKAEIPSKPAAIKAVDITGERWAGGNDLDRAFYDFNETEILASYWRAMNESYAMETDFEAARFLAANATAIETPATDFIRGIATAGLAVYDATKSAATFALVNPVDVPSVLDFAELDAPKYIDMVPIANPKNWTLSSEVDPGTAIVGTKSAVEFYELAGSPLRVEAEHLSHGGRDAALFGYTALNLAKPGGLQKVTISATEAPAV